MKYFVKFYETRTETFNYKTMQYLPCEPVYQELLGSDSIFILDGRNCIETMKSDILNRIDKLKAVKPHITGYKILKGETIARNTRVLYSSF